MTLIVLARINYEVVSFILTRTNTLALELGFDLGLSPSQASINQKSGPVILTIQH